jgi:hypothetical protein
MKLDASDAFWDNDWLIKVEAERHAVQAFAQANALIERATKRQLAQRAGFPGKVQTTIEAVSELQRLQ